MLTLSRATRGYGFSQLIYRPGIYRKSTSIQTEKPLTASSTETHVVFNQSRPFEDVDYYTSDKPLSTLMDSLLSTSTTEGDKERYQSQLAEYGKQIGSAGMMHLAREANLHKPQLHQFDLQGNRVDKTLYTSEYHSLMEYGISHHITNYGYQPAYNNNDEDEGVKQDSYNQHLVRAGFMYFENQLEPGHCCPLVMTSAAIPVFLKASSKSNNNDGEGSNYFASTWLPKLLSNVYDPRDVPVDEKAGVTIGMSMTEKQGGSDVRANTTIATPFSSSDGTHHSGDSGSFYTLKGHKWFTSAPMSDGFLTLAKTHGDSSHLTCFLVPRYKPDGSKNTGFRIMRLKNKMGDHSNGSSEVEYHDAFGIQIGEIGFYDVVPEPLLSVFDFQELELLLHGLPNIDMNDWKMNTDYTGEFNAQPNHKVVKWFWEIVTEMPQEQKAKLLQFVTGTAGVPVAGFAALQGVDGNARTFTIHGDKNVKVFPRAHTCFNRIDCPIYQSKADMKKYFTMAIAMESTGFGIE